MYTATVYLTWACPLEAVYRRRQLRPSLRGRRTGPSHRDPLTVTCNSMSLKHSRELISTFLFALISCIPTEGTYNGNYMQKSIYTRAYIQGLTYKGLYTRPRVCFVEYTLGGGWSSGNRSSSVDAGVPATELYRRG